MREGESKLKNRKNMINIVVLFCIAALTAFASIAQSDDEGCSVEHQSKDQRHIFEKIAHKLGLTDAQKAQSKTIFQENRDVVKPIIASLRAEQINLRALIHADNLDVAAIRAETAKISGIQADLNVDRANVEQSFAPS
jgi:periplasmic protein CpxP/Spy